MSEPERAIVYDQDTGLLIELPRTLLVQHDGRTRELRLRVARGVIRDAPKVEGNAP